MADGIPLELNPIVATITRWASENTRKVAEAYQMKGGWERWAQVELAIALRADHGWSYGSARQNSIIQEEPVHGTSQRTDIKVIHRGETNVIELDCESFHNSRKFISEVRRHLDRIEDGHVAHPYRTSKVWVMAFSVSKEAEKDLCWNEPRLYKYTPAQEAVKTPVTIWWWSKSFHS